ncbi:MAG: GAF domain-containing protein [Sphingomonadaceae bacterium]|nr:GAF domain-containing protein [Sphingomonadaceae bacterium]
MTDVGFRVDLSNCDREPIHILGAVQPFGCLIALSSDWMIARVSANSEAFFGRPPDALLGTPIVQLFAGEAVHAIRNRITLLRGADSTERLYSVDLLGDGRHFDVAVHISGHQVVIEAETAQEDEGDTAGTIRTLMARLDQAPSFDAFLRDSARQVRALTGFDRVMVYRFAEDGSGEVAAEAVRPGIGTFLGLHYPHTDIPAQARALYLRNLFRVIADVHGAPVPILPALDEKGQPLDLSLSVARSVSPIHLEYLANMGVDASLSISIVIEGRLWGLFACHHYAPRLPSLARRGLCELFGQMVSMKLEARERRARGDYVAQGRDVVNRLLTAVVGDESLLAEPAWLADILGEAIPADGVGVYLNGRMALSGLTPGEDEFLDVIRALNATAAGRVYATHRIADLLPEAERYAERAAGLLALPISRSPRDYVVLFRQEIIKTVRWAGDPNEKSVDYGPNGPRLTPRKSFESWSELVRGTAQPFTAAEISVADMLRGALVEILLRISDQANVERREAGERQAILIAELNHRVRNILSLIRGLVRQSRGASGSIEDFVGELEGRIQALARAHNQITAEHWGPGSLRGLIETEAGAYLGDKSDRVRTSGPDVLLNPQAFSTLALVFHELMTNSAKYGGLSDSGGVAVEWRLDDDGDLHVHWQERGGPPVKQPTRTGFGSTIIQRSIPYDLGGKAEVRYLGEGLEANFCVPHRHVSEGRLAGHAAEPRPEAIALSTSETPFEGETVLLVEDSLIIALDAEDILASLGAGRVLAAATVRQAQQQLDRERPDFALLDVNLGQETSFPIADRLKALGVPFLFATGYGEQLQLPPVHERATVLQKPYTAEAIAGALVGLRGS